MTTRRAALAIVLAGSVSGFVSGLGAGLATGAAAAPLAFTFDMPAFTSGSLTGQTTVLTVTADNGGTRAADQTFRLDQITAFDVVLGTRSLSLGAAIDQLSVSDGETPLLTTDARGRATLAEPDKSKKDGRAELRIESPAGTGSVALGLDGGKRLDYRLVIGGESGALKVTSVQSRAPTPIPLPAAAPLLLAAACCLLALRRRTA